MSCLRKTSCAWTLDMVSCRCWDWVLPPRRGAAQPAPPPGPAASSQGRTLPWGRGKPVRLWNHVGLICSKHPGCRPTPGVLWNNHDSLPGEQNVSHIESSNGFSCPSRLSSLRLWTFCIHGNRNTELGTEQQAAAKCPHSPGLDSLREKLCFVHDQEASWRSPPFCPPPAPGWLPLWTTCLTPHGVQIKIKLSYKLHFFQWVTCSQSNCYINSSCSLKRSHIFPKIAFLF